MAGIYLHVPFCRQACVYCDFHFITSLRYKAEMVAAMQQEIELRAAFFFDPKPLESIYLGGGTPSVLTASELDVLLTTVRRHFPVSPTAEITLEANPDDLSRVYMQEIKRAGINRLSIGIQAFDDAMLRWMNRSHTAAEALACVTTAQDIGLTNLSIDLIFGLPDQGLDHWESQVQQAIALDIPHLSQYALTVEDKTALAHQVQKGRVRLPDDPVYQAQFFYADEALTEAGYDHYELSNYARPPLYAVHNSNYWRQQPYLGIGPSAHSFDGARRSWNVAHNAAYLKHLQAGELAIAEEETLTQTDRYHEYVMTQLRKRTGLHLETVEQAYVPDWQKRFGVQVDQWKQEGFLIEEAGYLRPTPRGWLVSDHLIRELFID